MTTEITIDTGTSELLCAIRDRVAIITLNRPEVRNALSDNLTPTLRTMIKTCDENPEIGALLITGAGTAELRFALRSGRCLRTRVSPDYLRWLPEGAQEGAAHAVAIGKTGLPGDDVDRMAALLHHQPGGLDAQVLDRLGRRLAGLCAERTAELARTQVRGSGELSDRQRSREIALCI